MNKLRDDDARSEISPGSGITRCLEYSPRGDSVGVRAEWSRFAISGCIFHTSHAPPYLHRGLVISLEYNRPRDRQPLVLLASLPSPSRLLSFVVPVGDVEFRTGKRGMRDVCDRRETATMAEKALTASDGHICIRELLEV